MVKEKKTAIILVFAMVVIVGITFLHLNYGGYSIYSDNFEDELKTEQVVACYKGCQFTTQPTYENYVKNKTFRMNQYHTCIDLCEEWYYG